ncbi:hypothetical protein [Sphaerotilus mobilis]|uniref:Conjugative transfer region protein TrbK n=1 Tax=Sphaerotilus mobilis TaxID=47994 RepID=A0A4Q7L9W7_9BURK|nr:hypothetical protein EV685_3847 [Sphaerotilus mobilis]
MRRILNLISLLLAAGLMVGCDALGIESGTAAAARKEADGMAIGSACRHATRAIEDCYTLNPKATKSAVYAGWRDMDEYMRENKIDGIAPVIPRKSAKPAAPAASAADGEGAAADGHAEPADKADAHEAGPAKSRNSHGDAGVTATPAVREARASTPRQPTTH